MRHMFKHSPRILRHRSRISKPASPQPPNNEPRSSMAPRSLLRHVFRDLQPKIVSLRLATHDATLAAASSVPGPKNDIATADLTAAPLPHAAPGTPAPAMLEDIAEEPESDTTSHSSASHIRDEDQTWPKIASRPAIEFDALDLATQRLLETTFHEARTALHAHLNTLATTLAVLDALDGFSQTITVLRAEMLEAQRDCRGKLRMMSKVGDEVEDMGFPNDDTVARGGYREELGLD